MDNFLLPRITATDAGTEVPWPSDGSSYESNVRSWCESAFEEATYEQQQSEELRKIAMFQKYLAGKQWQVPRASYKSKPVNNRMFRLYWELVGQLTDIRPVIAVGTTDPQEEARKISENLTKGIRAWSINSKFDMTLAMCVCYALLTTSFAKVQFNPDLNMGEGELEVLPLPADAVMPLKGNPMDLYSSECIIYKKIVPLGWLRRKYGARASGVMPDPEYSKYETESAPPSNISPIMFNMLGGAMRQVLSGSPKINTSAIPMVLYREFWLKDYTVNSSNMTVTMGSENWAYRVPPGKPLYPRGRLIVMGGDKIVHDGPNPYWHGRPPFAMLRLNVVPWQFYGQSVLAPLMDLQDIVNNILAGMLDLVKKALNPPLIAPKNAFPESVWNTMDFSQPNARVFYNQQSAHEPKYGPVPQLPAMLLPLMQGIEKEMDQQSLGALVTEASRKKQMPGADAIEAMKSEKQTPIRLQGRNIEMFVQDLGAMMVPNIFQFWTVKKRIQVLGAEALSAIDFDWDPGTLIPAGCNPIEVVRRYGFQIQQGSLLNMKRVEEQAQLVGLRKMHEISRKTFFKLAQININADVEADELKKEAAMMPPPPPKGGKK